MKYGLIMAYEAALFITIVTSVYWVLNPQTISVIISSCRCLGPVIACWDSKLQPEVSVLSCDCMFVCPCLLDSVCFIFILNLSKSQKRSCSPKRVNLT